MVTKKELSGFKQTLTTALQKAGYTAYGRISSSEETYDTYANLPVREMVAKYVEDNNLDEINRVYRVIKFVNENSGNYYSLKTLCKENGIDYKVFNHAIENLSLVDKTGERRKTQYHWIHEEQPSFHSAKDIIEHMRKLKSTNLSKGLKDKIRHAVAEGISKDDFLKTNKVKKEATYSAEAFYNYQKTQQQKKDEPLETADLEETNYQPESLPIIPENELQEQESAGDEPVLNEEDTLTPSEAVDEASLEVENYILKQEIRYLKKINKAKDKLIKALRRKA
jgi:hypothetical protein